MSTHLTLDFSEISLADVRRVGGKNAALGALFSVVRPLGVPAIDGFCTTDDAYWLYLQENGLVDDLERLFKVYESKPESLPEVGAAARNLILAASMPVELEDRIRQAYRSLCKRLGRTPAMAVRSSGTAEDLPNASFAGQHDSFLNVAGEEEILNAAKRCLASLFNDRAIDYRARNGFGQLDVALSVGVMPMVRSDLGCSGVAFTLDPESGFRDVVVINGSYGYGETVVQGQVEPDEWTVFKPALEDASRPVISRRLGSKSVKLINDQSHTTQVVSVEKRDRGRFCLNDGQVTDLARWAVKIEKAFSTSEREQPMDIEWACDGETGAIYIIQARPETVHSQEPELTFDVYRLKAKPGTPLLTGQAVGSKIGKGRVRVISHESELAFVKPGEVLVSRTTNPDWEPVMQRVAALITDEGGRTAHAAIVSRELGLPCIVGCETATTTLRNGQMVTVCCAEGDIGRVYQGDVAFQVDRLNSGAWPHTRTKLMLNVGDPDRAFGFSRIPNDGVGLARMEFIVTNAIGVHPMALACFPYLKDKEALETISKILGEERPAEYFVGRLSEGIGKIAAAFFPKPVIVRTSDFKTNEYAKLIGGAEFEPKEDNPMLGLRGASRYYDERYAEGFALECAAIKRARDEMGLTNIRVMIPFCRTVVEAKAVIRVMTDHDLVQGQNSLEVYAMCEIPSNVILAEEFLEVFDGYSIGSNDLTQLILGVDRDSGTISRLFDEQDGAVKSMIASVIHVARKMGKPIGICGQAPSDYPGFAAWLIEEGITSISVNPDSALGTASAMAKAESVLPQIPKTARGVTVT